MLSLTLVLDHPFYFAIIPIVIFLIIFIYRDPPKRTRHGSFDQFSSSKIKTPTATFEMIPTNGIHLHTLCAGDKANPLVILLHGFPEFWKGWENQIDDLVNAGYYVMVPDQRGYNLSSKPLNLGDYKVTNLVNDIIGLVDFAKKEKAYLAGHDWGAIVAWYLVFLKPERFHKLLIVNVAHPVVFGSYYTKNKEQHKRSRYIRLFQIPYFPQRAISRNNFDLLEKQLIGSSRAGTFTNENLKAYKLAWNDPGTINCMLNWYRAAAQRRVKLNRDQYYVSIPVLILWGTDDKFLVTEMATSSLKYCKNGRTELIEGATHWVLHEKPKKVNKMIVDFFKASCSE